jgi:hypothetical protein
MTLKILNVVVSEQLKRGNFTVSNAAFSFYMWTIVYLVEFNHVVFITQSSFPDSFVEFNQEELSQVPLPRGDFFRWDKNS